MTILRDDKGLREIYNCTKVGGGATGNISVNYFPSTVDSVTATYNSTLETELIVPR